MTADDGQHHARVGRSSGQTERPRERERRRVDRRARLVDRRRRIERQIAPVEAVDDGDDVQPLGMGQYAPGSSSCARARPGSTRSAKTVAAQTQGNGVGRFT